jgi:hypothetical protein
LEIGLEDAGSGPSSAREIRQLQEVGIPSALLDRMLANIEGLCAERDRLRKDQSGSSQRQSPGSSSLMSGLKSYDHNADNPPWIKALAEVRHGATREGYCYQHVQAIIVAIDQYAERRSEMANCF